MEDRRRRRIAFENLVKGMLRYLDNSDDAKVGITEVQERVEVPWQFGISIQLVAQLARSESGQKIFEVILARRRIMYRQMGGEVERLVGLERRCQDMKREIQMLNKRQKYSQMRSMVGSECKTERVKDCRIKQLKK